MKENIFYAKDLGAVNDGKTLNTAAVQSAIDKIAQSGGGKLVFSDGEYVLSTVFLKNINFFYVLSSRKPLRAQVYGRSGNDSGQ